MGSKAFSENGNRTFQDVEANSAQLVNVGVVDLGDEADLGRGHGVVLGQKELQFEHASLEGRSLGTWKNMNFRHSCFSRFAT